MQIIPTLKGKPIAFSPTTIANQKVTEDCIYMKNSLPLKQFTLNCVMYQTLSYFAISEFIMQQESSESCKTVIFYQ